MTERLAKLEGAFDSIRISMTLLGGAVALVMAVMLGGFTWLSTQISRIEAKVDTVSIKVAEMPGVFQRDLQAQTERLTALINARQQSGSIAPPEPLRATPGALPGPNEPPRIATIPPGGGTTMGMGATSNAVSGTASGSSTGTPLGQVGGGRR